MIISFIALENALSLQSHLSNSSSMESSSQDLTNFFFRIYLNANKTSISFAEYSFQMSVFENKDEHV